MNLRQSAPYSGPGGKVDLLQFENGYSPLRTAEATWHLVEQGNIFAIFRARGADQNSAIKAYISAHKMPRIIYVGAIRFAGPAEYAWSISFSRSHALEGCVPGGYDTATGRGANARVIYQNDGSVCSYLAGFKQCLGDHAASKVVCELSFAESDPTIPSQSPRMKMAGADVVFDASTVRTAVQAIKGIADLAWKPLQLITSPASPIQLVIESAGAAYAIGVVTAVFLTTVGDPGGAHNQDVKDFEAFVKNYDYKGQASDVAIAIGYTAVAIFVDPIEQIGKSLSWQSCSSPRRTTRRQPSAWSCAASPSAPRRRNTATSTRSGLSVSMAAHTS